MEVVPAGVLGLDEVRQKDGEAIETLLRREAAFVRRLRLADAVFDALQDAGDTNFDELVEIASGDGEELYALKQRVGGILRFFEDALVEVQPGFVAREEEGIYRVLGERRGFGCGAFSRSIIRRGAFCQSTFCRNTGAGGLLCSFGGHKCLARLSQTGEWAANLPGQ